MLTKEHCESVYQNIEDGGYLDDWVLNCARAVRDQAISAITLTADLELLKSEHKELAIAYGKLYADLAELKAFHDRYAQLESEQYAKLDAEIERLKQDIAYRDIQRIADNQGEMFRIQRISDLQAENNELRAERRWIPVSERLPEFNKPVALTNENQWVNVDFDYHVTQVGFLDSIGDHKFWDVYGERAQSIDAYTHWGLLPAAPEREESK